MVGEGAPPPPPAALVPRGAPALAGDAEGTARAFSGSTTPTGRKLWPLTVTLNHFKQEERDVFEKTGLAPWEM